MFHSGIPLLQFAGLTADMLAGMVDRLPEVLQNECRKTDLSRKWQGPDVSIARILARRLMA